MGVPAVKIDETEARHVADDLRAEALAAGLDVVTLRTMPCHGGRWGCFLVDLRGPDGVTWMEGSHESESSVRQAIVLYVRGHVRGHVLEWTRRNLRDMTWSVGCACGSTFRAQTWDDAARGVWEHRDELAAELAEAVAGG
jgi:hypothetical protein